MLLLIFSAAIIYTTDRNIQIVRTLAVQSLTDTAVGLSSAADNALRTMGDKTSSNIRAVFSDRIVAYALVAEKSGNIRFHTNPRLINTKLSPREMDRWISGGTFSSRRILLGTGVPAYEFNFVMYRPDEAPQMLRLVLHTLSADTMIRQAERMWWIAGLLLVLLWMAGIVFERFFTNRMKTQAARENQKRLTLIGQMTAVLAHEIRNALGSVKGYAQWLEEKAVAGSTQKEALAVVVKGALRIESLVQELLIYSKEETCRLELVELASLVREAIAIGTAGWPGETQMDVAPDTVARGDREKIHRVVVNGIRNALDAMGEKGRLTISSFESGRRVGIRIEDTGGGISKQDRVRLFTPFYTTKTDGTGLGLAYAKKVVEGMGGAIALTNRNGATGAALTIELRKGKVK